MMNQYQTGKNCNGIFQSTGLAFVGGEGLSECWSWLQFHNIPRMEAVLFSKVLKTYICCTFWRFLSLNVAPWKKMMNLLCDEIRTDIWI
jgi:hypothetical protein